MISWLRHLANRQETSARGPVRVPNRRFQPTIELLEAREVPALTASLVSGVLMIDGTDAPDTIVVHQIDNRISIDSLDQTFASSSVQSISIMGRSGDDFINLGTGSLPGHQPIRLPANIDGGQGNDIVIAGAVPPT
jgi:hypothetical protein